MKMLLAQLLTLYVIMYFLTFSAQFVCIYSQFMCTVMTVNSYNKN